MAGRIPEAFIDDLLDRLDIVEVIDRRVKLKKSGRNYMACCPFHDEKTPSFSVNQEKQFYHCFGCGAGGNMIGFLMDYERLDFPRCIETLADMAGLEVPREASVFKEEPQLKRNIYTLLEKAASHYQRLLKEHPNRPRVVDYLKSRGLSGEIARDFGIGYAAPGWDNLLKELGHSDEDKQLLIDGGMLIEKPEENKCYDRFRDRIMFPIHDNRGRVIAFGGRVLGDDKPKYLNSPETPVFHKGRELYGLYQARKNNRQLRQLVVVEGYMDVVALAQHGIGYAVATLGTATSTDHLKRIFRQCPEVVFCFDGDEAGRKAATRALESALPVMEDGRQAKFLFLPQGEDPDSLVRKVGSNEFKRLIDKAAPLENYLFEHLAQDIDISSLEGRARMSKLAAPLIDQLPQGVFKSLMMSSLAERTGLAEDKLIEIIAQQPKPKTRGQATAQDQQHEAYNSKQSHGDNQQAPFQTNNQPKQRSPLPPKANIHRDPVLYAIGLLILYPKAGAQLPEFNIDNDQLELQLLRDIITLTQKRPDSTTYMILANWQQQPWKGLIEEALNQAHIFGVQGSAENPEQELSDTIKHILRNNTHIHLDQQVDKLLATNYADLSTEDKEQLKQLLAQKHS
ncbi:DNA primase [Dasania sp. GY-MA-18]|uniref:DNA primase n=1 Tax=Dasania phycosphaerae TaxID=2950436 RepID=A0A9J6RK22_9GAMM|nr:MULTISPECIES: DNA primase [Dasania]MCR8922328.1 DNA primase [Dasania sp. GY-MA-18]MCZ0864756.1 DNA primase [Dasania phycosphaerae]MCZ0868484.1 DNA primase [Dasania phycosphaerae]